MNMQHLPFVEAFGRPRSGVGSGRIPVFAVTGFLGAGKTTFIKGLLAGEALRDTAIIVNEFGDVGIDDALLRSSTDQMVLIGGGCICCAARSDLQQALQTLFADRASGKVPSFRRVIIETSGLADPGAILQTFASDRTIGNAFALASVIAVVDGLNAAHTATTSPEWGRQVALADRILITKADLIPPSAVEGLCNLLATYNPAAPTEIAASVVGRIGWLEEASADGSRFACRAMPAEPEHDLTPYRTFTLECRQPLAWSTFDCFVDALMRMSGSDLLRAKGLVQVRDRNGPVLVQFVRHLAHPPSELREWPDGKPLTRLVFITDGLGREPVQALFDAVIALEKTS